MVDIDLAGDGITNLVGQVVWIDIAFASGC